MLNIKTLIAGATLAAASITAFAQPAHTPGVDARQANQAARIDAGRANGSLSKREARRLEQQQAEIRRYERRAKADGVVTPAGGARHAAPHAAEREPQHPPRKELIGRRQGRPGGSFGPLERSAWWL